MPAIRFPCRIGWFGKANEDDHEDEFAKHACRALPSRFRNVSKARKRTSERSHLPRARIGTLPLDFAKSEEAGRTIDVPFVCSRACASKVPFARSSGHPWRSGRSESERFFSVSEEDWTRCWRGCSAPSDCPKRRNTSCPPSRPLSSCKSCCSDTSCTLGTIPYPKESAGPERMRSKWKDPSPASLRHELVRKRSKAEFVHERRRTRKDGIDPFVSKRPGRAPRRALETTRTTFGPSRAPSALVGPGADRARDRKTFRTASKRSNASRDALRKKEGERGREGRELAFGLSDALASERYEDPCTNRSGRRTRSKTISERVLSRDTVWKGSRSWRWRSPSCFLRRSSIAILPLASTSSRASVSFPEEGTRPRCFDRLVSNRSRSARYAFRNDAFHDATIAFLSVESSLGRDERRTRARTERRADVPRTKRSE